MTSIHFMAEKRMMLCLNILFPCVGNFINRAITLKRKSYEGLSGSMVLNMESEKMHKL